MAVHAIIGYIAYDSGMTVQEIQDAVDDWVSKRAKWESDWSTDVRVSNTSFDGDGIDFCSFSVRFEWSEDKDNTLQKCADKFKKKVDWFRLVYHECDHDASNPTGCSWDERWEWEAKDVIVPPEIDDFIPDATVVDV